MRSCEKGRMQCVSAYSHKHTHTHPHPRRTHKLRHLSEIGRGLMKLISACVYHSLGHVLMKNIISGRYLPRRLIVSDQRRVKVDGKQVRTFIQNKRMIQ